MNRRRLAQSIIMIACRDRAQQYLLFNWRRHPYRGLVSLPFGRQLAGNSSASTAKEQLLLKTGYIADLQFAGLADIISGSPTSTSHRSCQIFIGTNLTQITQPDGLTGTYFWGNPADIDPIVATAGFHKIIQWLEISKREHLLEIIEVVA